MGRTGLFARLLACMPLLAGTARAGEEVSGAGITRPEGVYLRYDWWRPIADSRLGTLEAGFFDSWLVYSDEVGARIGFRTRPAWLEAHVEAALEPGLYIHLPASGLPSAGPPPSGRLPDYRETLRAQANLNLRGDSWWIYSRSTAEAHYRAFPEYDEFREIVLSDQEYDLEEAIAPLVRVAGTPEAGWWVYTEYTRGAVLGTVTLPYRWSVGVLPENWPVKGLTLDLDLYWSFADKPGPGPGAIFAWWWFF